MATLAHSEGTNAPKGNIVFTGSQRAGWQFDNSGSWRTLGSAWKGMPNELKLMVSNSGTSANCRNIALDKIALSRPVVGTDCEVVIRAEVQNAGDRAVTPDKISELRNLFISEKEYDYGIRETSLWDDTAGSSPFPSTAGGRQEDPADFRSGLAIASRCRIS